MFSSHSAALQQAYKRDFDDAVSLDFVTGRKDCSTGLV